ncbi:hypothetical protein [Streptomyces sp. LMG1-1-1.1]|uniref:hypothetical protein n=1 Tax=Streptomyces sp. LMG1-1-1.1 TaxID=3135245 RepID=UPI0034652CC5
MTCLQAHQLREYIDESAIRDITVLGATYTCTYEPVGEIAAELDRIHRERGSVSSLGCWSATARRRW